MIEILPAQKLKIEIADSEPLLVFKRDKGGVFITGLKRFLKQHLEQANPIPHKPMRRNPAGGSRHGDLGHNGHPHDQANSPSS